MYVFVHDITWAKNLRHTDVLNENSAAYSFVNQLAFFICALMARAHAQ